VSLGIGNIYTDPLNRDLSFGWASISAIFVLNPPFLFFLRRLRNIISKMSPSDKQNYLTVNILTIGISSLTTMTYLALDTIKCLSKLDNTVDNAHHECSGVLNPQQSVCIFLLCGTIFKIVMVPLSDITIKAIDLIKLNVPRRFVFHGALVGLSGLLNVYLFANIIEGPAKWFVRPLTAATIILIVLPMGIETLFMVFFKVHRTSRSPNQARENQASLFSSREDNSLSVDPMDGGMMGAFV